MLINDQEMPNPYIGYKANDTFITKYKVLSKIADVLAQWTDLWVAYVFIAVRKSIKIISLQMYHITFNSLRAALILG